MRAALCTAFVCLLTWALPRAASAEQLLTVRFTPTARAQIAIWLEDADGQYIATLRLTDAVALRGIGNRPGALQMNSGFRWPYGRREGVLPVWAHRRAEADGAQLFPFVIFQDRTFEGLASRTSSDASRDDYFCLSFDRARSGQDTLDAVTCASVFNSDKGRYMTPTDVSNGYAEPFETFEGVQTLRALPLASLYPPRRDLVMQFGDDHPDISRFRADTEAVMPEIDAVSMATLQGGMRHTLQHLLVEQLPPGQYVLWLEIHGEGDHNATYNETTYPTPDRFSTTSHWDSWARTYGYAYRGQPAVVYRLPFGVDSLGGTFSTDTPHGYAEIHGADGAVRPIDDTITDDPTSAPGRGADRLRKVDMAPRLVLVVSPDNVCSGDDPPPPCGLLCELDTACPEGFLCGSQGTCVGRCDEPMPPPAVAELSLDVHPDIKSSHHFARMSFVPTASRRPVVEYRVKVSRAPILTESDFQTARNANAADIDTIGLSICETDMAGEVRCPSAGALMSVDIGQLTFDTTHYVAIRPVDACGAVGPFVASEVTTTPIDFTTVSPCFVATAAYGSPMADEVEALRRFRDRFMAPTVSGRAFITAYYTAGPHLADAIRDSPRLRAASRAVLAPFVALAEALTDPSP